jgi:hypothetical protein
VVFCVKTPYGIVSGYRRFGGPYCFHIQDYTVSESRWQRYELSVPWKPQISWLIQLDNKPIYLPHFQKNLWLFYKCIALDQNVHFLLRPTPVCYQYIGVCSVSNLFCMYNKFIRTVVIVEFWILFKRLEYEAVSLISKGIHLGDRRSVDNAFDDTMHIILSVVCQN